MKESILKRYPELKEDDVILRDDGAGVFISVWKSNETKPTMSQVNQWVIDDATLPKPLTIEEQNAKDLADLTFQLMLAGVIQ